jgi:hypothetical protein
MSEFAFTINDTVAMIGVKHEDPDPYKNCKKKPFLLRGEGKPDII